MKVPRSLRTRVTLAATVAFALWVTVVTIGFNLVLTNRLAAQADDTLRVRAEAVASTLVVSSAGQVTVRDTRGDAAIDLGTWIFQGRRLVEGPNITTPLGQQAQSLASPGHRFTQTNQPYPVRLYGEPVISRGHTVATIVTSIPLTPYTQARQAALLGSAVLATMLLSGVFLVLRTAVSRALSPVEAMTRQAAVWSTTDVTGRFGIEARPTELAVLARNLDALLDRLAAVLRHEQQLAAELSHELRTPLSRIIAETDLLQEGSPNVEDQDAGHAAITQSAEQMRDIVETLLDTARTATGARAGRCDAGEVVRALAAHAVTAMSQTPVVTVQTQGDTSTGVDAAVLERALAPVLDNSRRYATHKVHVQVHGLADATMIDVLDDGPGIAHEALPHVFEPGRRADPDDGHHGAGLGLALSRRLLLASGGEITASSSPSGAAFHLKLPRG